MHSRRKLLLAAVVATASLTMPVAADAASHVTHAKHTAHRTAEVLLPFTMSGATADPKNPEPADGILQGGFCTPDVHTFNKNQVVPGQKPGTKSENHIVFAVNVTPVSKNAQAFKNFDAKGVKVFVDISNLKGKVLARVNLPLSTPPDVDPHTHKPFFSQCVWLHNPLPVGTYINFPTGKYSYKFVAVEKVGAKKRVESWTPGNHTFTIVG